jgi:hypothetical protein
VRTIEADDANSRLASRARFAPWAHAVGISLGLAAPATASAQTSPEAPDAHAASPVPVPASADAEVYVHIEGSTEAQLQRRVKGHPRRWENVCSAPCDQTVSLADTYRIAGAGIRRSHTFELQAQPGERKTLTVDEGSKVGAVFGFIGVFAGSAAVVIGLVGLAINTGATPPGSSASDHREGEEISVALLGFGLVSLAGGIVLLATNPPTGVSQTPLSAPAAGASWLGPSLLSGAVPVDTRRTSLVAPVLTIPIFSGRF